LNRSRRQLSLESPGRGGRSGIFDRILHILKWGCYVVAGTFITSVLLVAIYAVIPVPMTPLMVIRSVTHMGEGKAPVWKRDWISLDQISPRLQTAAIAAEDARFFKHNGFDFEAIDKAIQYNQKSTRRVRGGSTISQQVAKNVFLWPSRSWVRKGIEVYFTGLIELLWSKRRILEVYLNVAEFGDGIYGAEAASQVYFRKPAAKLNASEAALLTAVLPNPRRFSVAKPSGYVRLRQTMIQRRMTHVGRPTWH
jgi:monofunctional biosynthetic peptidoglycan transglycosylase